MPKVRFTDVRGLKWEKDYLEYVVAQVPFFRLYAVTDTQKMEEFCAPATDEVVKEEAARGIAKVLNLSS